MEAPFYTIELNDNPYLSPHPALPGSTAAWIYRNPSWAARFIKDVDDPWQWSVTPVPNLEEWLMTLLDKEIMHVIEQFSPLHSTDHEVFEWLTLLSKQRKRGLIDNLF